MSRVEASPSATFLAAGLARSARFLTSVAPAGLVAKASRPRTSAVEHLTAARNDRSLLNWMSEKGRLGLLVGVSRIPDHSRFETFECLTQMIAPFARARRSRFATRHPALRLCGNRRRQPSRLVQPWRQVRRFDSPIWRHPAGSKPSAIKWLPVDQLFMSSLG